MMTQARARTPLSNGSPVEPVPRRPIRSRLSMGHIIMVAAGLLAFLLVLTVLRDQSDTTFVAVTAADIEAGTRVGSSAIDFREVNVEDQDLFEAFLDQPEMQLAIDDGAIATRTITVGDVLLESDFRVINLVGSGQRAQSIQIDPGRAAAGNIAVSDRIDIIEVVGDSGALFIATDVEVIAVSSPQSTNLGTSGEFTITVAVDADTSLRLSFALATRDVFIVRATGANAADPALEYLPALPDPPVVDLSVGSDDA